MNRISKSLNETVWGLCGKELYWTAKLDGSNIGIYWNGEKYVARSRNQDIASDQFLQYLEQTDEWIKVCEMLTDERENWNSNWIVYGELLCHGKSPTRMFSYEGYKFVVFDMWNVDKEYFINYNGVYQKCYHWEIPVVQLLGICRKLTPTELFEFRDKMMRYCEENRIEGCVVKMWESDGSYGYYKEKIDIPEPLVHKEIDEGDVMLPILPDSEIYGAIDKVRVDIGDEQFCDVKVAMPMVAKYVRDECNKHGCIMPSKKLFEYYKEVLE